MATQIPVPTFIAKRYLNPKTNPESKPNADKTRPPFSAASGKVSVDGSWSKLTNNPDPELGLKPETPDVAITIHDGSAEKSDGEKNSNEGVATKSRNKNREIIVFMNLTYLEFDIWCIYDFNFDSFLAKTTESFV